MKSNISKLRSERNLTQKQLAKVIGKTQQAVSIMENDRDRIPIESLITLADYFGVSTDCILGIAPEEQKQENKKANTTENVIDNISDEDNTNKRIYQIILSLLLYSLEGNTPLISETKH